MRTRVVILVAAALLIGIVLGAYFFKDTRARSFLSLPSCGTACLSRTELVGLLVSVGVQKIPSVIPVVKETDKVIAIKSPDPLATIDYLVLPKKDIRDLGDLSADDRAYLDDTFLLISELVRDNHLVEYKIISNGPGFQAANYLHFHLLAQ